MVVHNNIKIGQQNLHGSNAATVDCIIWALDNEIDVLLLQDPYSYKKVSNGLFDIPGGFGSKGVRMVANCDEKIGACIMVFNKNISIMSFDQVSTQNLSIARLEWGNNKIICCSAYWRPSRNFDLTSELEFIKNTIPAIAGEDAVIMGADTNAHHEFWYSANSGERGDEVVDFLIQMEWSIFNRPSIFHTFDGIRGSSNIDITIGSGHIENKICNWQVLNRGLSDHNLITFEIGFYINKDRFDTIWCRTKINAEKAIDTAILQMARVEAILWEPTTENLEVRAVALQEALVKIMQESVAKRKVYYGKPIWWNDHVQKARDDSSAARRSYQRCRDPILRAELRERYLSRAGKLRKIILNEKSKTWSTFASEQLRNDPWSIPYKIAAGKLKKPNNIIGSLSTMNGNTLSFEDTASEILNEFLAADDPEQDTVEQSIIRDQADVIYGNRALREDVRTEEVEDYLVHVNIKKAPGPDGVTGIVVKTVAMVIADFVTRLFNDCFMFGYFPRVWKTGKLVTIPKPGRVATSAKDLRPITLLPIMGKALEHFVKKRMIDSREEGFHHPNQYGFVNQKKYDRCYLRTSKKGS